VRPSAVTPTAESGRARQIAGTVGSWIGGGFFVLVALGALFTNVLAASLFLVAAALLLPPVTAWLKASSNLVIPGKVKAWAVLGLMVGAAFSIAASTTREQERDAARATSAHAAAVRVDFQTNRAAILRRMDSAATARSYPLVVSIGEKYAAAVPDSQLTTRLRDARAAQTRKADSVREQQLLARASQLPADDLEANRDLYQKLLALNPSNASYKAKYADYSNRLRQREAAEQDRIKRFGPVPQASAWDGSYSEVKDYLRQVMNDPESLRMDSCTGVYHVERGWLVGCDYGGRNKFGGMIRQSNWFIIRHGRVVEMKEASAYRP